MGSGAERGRHGAGAPRVVAGQICPRPAAQRRRPVLRRTLSQACASACGLAQDCAAGAAEDHRLAVREHRGDCEAPLVSRARGAVARVSAPARHDMWTASRGCATQMAAHLALHVHEEAVWRLHQPLQLVLPLLIVRRRVQQVQVRRKHLGSGGRSAAGLKARASRDGQAGQGLPVFRHSLRAALCAAQPGEDAPSLVCGARLET